MEKQKHNNNPFNHPVKFTEPRARIAARLTTRFCQLHRNFYGRMETDQELTMISIFAEETAMLLPEDARLNDLNKMSTEQILGYIEYRHMQETGNNPRKSADTWYAWVVDAWHRFNTFDKKTFAETMLAVAALALATTLLTIIIIDNWPF